MALPARAIDRISQLSSTTLQTLVGQRPLSPTPDGRHIPLDPWRTAPLADPRRRAGRTYVSNSIRTSRYTAWDFLPKQLVFQFSRLHNFYFLMTSLFQVLGWGTVGKFTSILPLSFFVLLTIAKEGWDDLRRHRLDNLENASPVAVLGSRGTGHGKRPERAPRQRWRPWAKNTPPAEQEEGRKVADDHDDHDDEHQGLCWVTRRWVDVKVGDVIRLSRDEPVPADIVLLHGSGPNNSAYIETMALDGETNLKSRHVSPLLPPLSTIASISSCSATVVAEDPNPDLYRFDGRLMLNGETRPLTGSDVAYRGSVVRNTDLVVGLVVNTGEECKARLNANQHPQAKRPALEGAVSKTVVVLVAYVLMLSGAFTAAYLHYRNTTEARSWYLVRSTVPIHHIIFGFVILFNNIIPLSLYVTLELIKVGQLVLLNSDLAMYHQETDTPARCNTNTILENLGQVGYVFSDKTGTLTENVMKFRKISVGGVVWAHDAKRELQSSPIRSDVISDMIPEEGSPEAASSSSQPSEPGAEPDPDPELSTADLVEYIRTRPHTPLARRAREYLLSLALCHTCVPETVGGGEIRYQASSPDELALVDAAKELGFVFAERTARTATVVVDGRRLTYEMLDVIEFSSKRKRMTVVVRCPDGTIQVMCKGADSVVLQRLRMTEDARRKACETRASIDAEHEISRRSDQHELRTSFALRRLSGTHTANANRHSVDISRLRRSADLVMHSPISPRMSADAWRSPYARGGGGGGKHPPHPHAPDPHSHLDHPRFLNDEPTIFSRCFRHLDAFAAAGLRTLVFAQKIISDAEYQAWKAEFDEATTSLVDRQERIERAGEKMENNFELLGASAIEDKLQRGVPETVDKLRRAGIKVWMLTGDKRETAVNIARSAGICRPASDVFVIDSEKKAPLADQISALAEDLGSGAVLHSVAVVDGHTLGLVEKSSALAHAFFSAVPLVDSVICCRASPAQKALLVRTVRSRVGASGGLTLAIGDGANDLAMIEASHVGIGISGREGLQAARVADYAIAQFRFLQRLLLVHGRWNYARTCKFVLGTFWKEVFFYLPAALYQMETRFTGTSLYQETSLMVFNTLFTSLCLLVMGVTEQDLRAETLLAVPELYVYGQRGLGMNMYRCASWLANALMHGAIAWFVLYSNFLVPSGHGDDGLYALGHAVFTVGVVWINTKLFILETHHKTVVVAAGYAVTVAGWWVWTVFLDRVYAPSIGPYRIRGTFLQLFGRDPRWWMAVLQAVVVMWLAEGLIKTAVKQIRTRGWDGRQYHADDRACNGGESDDMTTSTESFSMQKGSSSVADGGRWRIGSTVKRWRSRWGLGIGMWEVAVWQQLERREGVRKKIEEMVREEEAKYLP